MIEQLQLYLSYPFVRYAIIVGVLIALCSSLLGVTLVLKRFSFIGDGLSHVAFGAMSVATVLKLSNQMVLILPITILCAVLLLRTGKKTRIKGDAAIAMISVGALAFGYLIMNLFSTSSNLTGDVCSTLFGSTSILTLTQNEVLLCAVLSVVVILIFVFFYHKIFAVTFDEDFAKAVGTNTGTYQLIIAVTIAVIIVLAMNLVGSLLISALVIFPALSAMRLFHSFRAVTIFSAFLSVFCALSGILISVLAGTPVGSTIVAVDVAGFFLCCLVEKVFSRNKRKSSVLLGLFLAMLLMGCAKKNTTPVVSATNAAAQDSSASSLDSLPKASAEASSQAGAASSLASISQESTTSSSAASDRLGSTTSSAAPDRQESKNASVTSSRKKTDSSVQDGTAGGTNDSKAAAVSGKKEKAEKSSANKAPSKPEKVDLDLTTMSSTMVYSEVFNMVTTPENYIGKTVKMRGTYMYYYDEKPNRYYFFCLISDAMACCSQGIEFALTKDYHYPEDYPKPDDEITVVGVFDSYEEEGNTYCILRNARLVP